MTTKASPQLDDSSLVHLMMALGGSLNGEGKPITTWTNVQRKLADSGILATDLRVKDFCDAIKSRETVSFEQFQSAALNNVAFLKAVADKQLVISDFASFSDKLQYLFEKVEPLRDGLNAQYIPTLRDADPEQYGMAFTSIDGQFFEAGDSRSPFTIQSVSKPIMMGLAMEKLSLRELEKWVGVSPSGRPFNDAALLPDGRPFNPMVNTGAMMTSAVVASAHPDMCISDFPDGEHGERSQHLMEEVLCPNWSQLSGNGIVGEIGFDHETFLGERRTGDTNVSLANLMRDKTGLPDPVSLETMLDFYFRQCSLEATCAIMSVVAATLANGGNCPLTGKQVFSSATVRHMLSSMVLTGMYDAAGDFYMKIGAPAKSGVSGIVMVVIPRVGGYCVFSPRLDSFGNSIRGVAFAEAVANVFNFHAFDTIGFHTPKIDPRRSSANSREIATSQLRWAISLGDKQATRFADVLKWTGVCTAAIEGCSNQIHVIQQAYHAITHSRVTRQDLESLSAKIKGVGTEKPKQNKDLLNDLVTLLDDNATSLKDFQKDFILEMVILVVETSCRKAFNPTEWSIVHDICKALEVPTDILPMKTMSKSLQIDLKVEAVAQ